MQATIDSFALKPFVRALTCLSRYGDEILIHATAQTMSVSATSQSMSAYCRFMWDRQFFVRYTIQATGDSIQPDGSQEGEGIDESVKGQLLVKSLLSILKHKTVEKSVEKCELIIAHPSNAVSVFDDSDPNVQDSLESTLVVRLHCHHGIVKTHRLLMNEPESLVAPSVPESQVVSHVTLPARTIKDMLEHFPVSHGGGGKESRNDPQVVWTFEDGDVHIRSFERSVNTGGKIHLNTELKIGIDEFEAYDIPLPPVTIAHHLREFNATIAFADSLSLSMAMHLTTSTAPLFIDLDGGDGFDALFVISTTTAGNHFARNHAAQLPKVRPANGVANARKRPRTESASSASGTPPGTASGEDSYAEPPRTPVAQVGAAHHTPQRVTPQWAVQRTDTTGRTRAMSSDRAASPDIPVQPSRAVSFEPMGPPPDPEPRYDSSMSGNGTELGPTQQHLQEEMHEPLFFPSSQDLGPPMSQLQLDAQAEVKGLTDAALDALMADDDFGYEADGSFAVLSSQRDTERELLPMNSVGYQASRMLHASLADRHHHMDDTDEVIEDEMLPTQSTIQEDKKTFHPLFED